MDDLDKSITRHEAGLEHFSETLKLKGPANWDSWRAELMNILFENRIFDIIFNKPTTSGSAPTLAIQPDDGKSRDIDFFHNDTAHMTRVVKADRLINQTLTPTAGDHVRGLNNPVEKWKKLEEWCIGAGPIQQQIAYGKLTALKAHSLGRVERLLEPARRFHWS
jgi:hypothetical protein